RQGPVSQALRARHGNAAPEARLRRDAQLGGEPSDHPARIHPASRAPPDGRRRPAGPRADALPEARASQKARRRRARAPLAPDAAGPGEALTCPGEPDSRLPRVPDAGHRPVRPGPEAPEAATAP